LLVYVDDATGTLMELRFVEVESTFGYFASTVTYLRRHGKPVAFFAATNTASSASTTRAPRAAPKD
jgi:hypothetical protein